MRRKELLKSCRQVVGEGVWKAVGGPKWYDLQEELVLEKSRPQLGFVDMLGKITSRRRRSETISVGWQRWFDVGFPSHNRRELLGEAKASK